MIKYAIVVSAALALSGCAAAIPALLTGVGGVAGGSIIGDILLATKVADDAIAIACSEYHVKTARSSSRMMERQSAISEIRKYLDVACSHGVPNGTVETAVWIALNIGEIVSLADT